MQAIMIGNVLDAVCTEIEKSISYLEHNVLRGVVGQFLPRNGIVVQASRDELKNNDELGTWLYHDIEIKAKEDK